MLCIDEFHNILLKVFLAMRRANCDDPEWAFGRLDKG
jgi:hypothetical protein